MGDWYRHEFWGAVQQRDFETRLARARKSSRAQYLRIQAFHIGRWRPRAALGLLQRVIEQPDSGFELAQTYCQIGECRERLGDRKAALKAYEASIDQMRKRPTSLTYSWRNYGLLVARMKDHARFPEALAVVDEFGQNELLPVEKFLTQAVQAMIAQAEGRLSDARGFARRALQETRKSHSGLRYHATFGLVGPDNLGLVLTMRALCWGNPFRRP